MDHSFATTDNSCCPDSWGCAHLAPFPGSRRSSWPWVLVQPKCQVAGDEWKSNSCSLLKKEVHIQKQARRPEKGWQWILKLHQQMTCCDVVGTDHVESFCCVLLWTHWMPQLWFALVDNASCHKTECPFSAKNVQWQGMMNKIVHLTTHWILKDMGHVAPSWFFCFTMVAQWRAQNKTMQSFECNGQREKWWCQRGVKWM